MTQTNQNKIRCAGCQKSFSPAASNFVPFCSERCKLLDLGKWTSEAYTIPGEKVEIEEVLSETRRTEN